MNKKPCPFCGNKVTLDLQVDGGIGYQTGYRIVCLKCSAKGPHIPMKMDTTWDAESITIAAWNNRKELKS